ncbi:MAG: hypothetical protein WA364_11765 [Candidatus Nitrosopolaris sp.]
MSQHLILWQIGIIGNISYDPYRDNKLDLHILANYLQKYYDHDYEVYIYQASEFVDRLFNPPGLTPLPPLGVALLNFFSVAITICNNSTIDVKYSRFRFISISSHVTDSTSE